MKPIRIAGYAHSKFGKLENQSLESLIHDIGIAAINNSEIDPKDLDGVWVSNFNGGLQKSNFISSMGLLDLPELRFKPTVRVENACASGSAAVFAAIDALESGRAKSALVIGAEKMTDLDTKEVTDVLARASHLSEEYEKGLSFPGIFAKYADAYFKLYGNQSKALAQIAVKNHENGMLNELAHLQKLLDVDFCLSESPKNPIVAPPLKRSDCSPISDGAAAIILTTTPEGRMKNVQFRSRYQVNDYLALSKRDFVKFEGPRLAWQKALAEAKCTINNLDLFEVHDCFTIAELLSYEAIGLAERGQGWKLLDDGATKRDGKFPVNVSGGLKTKGHPIGATGVSMLVMAARQIAGEAGALQLKKANMVGVFNMGGSGVANYVSILESA